MRSRFEWGLITDVQAPDLETRIAILRKKAASERIDIGDEVAEFMASKVSSNVRELEGALIRVTAFANLNQSTIDVPLVQSVLKDLVMNLIFSIIFQFLHPFLNFHHLFFSDFLICYFFPFFDFSSVF